MSHFTVMVIGHDPEDQLAPYSEHIEVEPYRDYWDSREIRRWEEILTNDVIPGGKNWDSNKGEYVDKPESKRPDHEVAKPSADGNVPLEELVRVYNERYSDGEEDRVFLDEQAGIYQMSTYSQKSKWDWYQVGGRWRGFFKLKDPSNGSVGGPGTFGNDKRYDADECLKGEINAEYMRSESSLNAVKRWEQAQQVFGELPVARSWDEFVIDALDPITGDPKSPESMDEARKLYYEQPRVKAVTEHDKTLPWEKSLLARGEVEDYQISKEDFVQYARDAALTTYAYVYEGEWHAPGKMGWFGMSSESKSDKRRYAREFNEFFDALPDDTLITVYDCHI